MVLDTRSRPAIIPHFLSSFTTSKSPVPLAVETETFAELAAHDARSGGSWTA